MAQRLEKKKKKEKDFLCVTSISLSIFTLYSPLSGLYINMETGIHHFPLNKLMNCHFKINSFNFQTNLQMIQTYYIYNTILHEIVPEQSLSYYVCVYIYIYIKVVFYSKLPESRKKGVARQLIVMQNLRLLINKNKNCT